MNLSSDIDSNTNSSGNGRIWQENLIIKISSNGTENIYPQRNDDDVWSIIRRWNESDRRIIYYSDYSIKRK
jgi:hypothetical protein